MADNPRPDYGSVMQRLKVEGSMRRRHRRHHAHRTLPLSIRRVIQIFLCVGLLTSGIIVTGLFVFDRTYKGRILPNITIQGVVLNKKTPDEAAKLLQEQYALVFTTPVTFVFEGQRWQPHPDDIGLDFQIDETIARAYALGRGTDLFANIFHVVHIWRKGLDLPIRMTLDQQRLQTYLATIGGEIEIEPRNADLAVLEGQIVTVPDQIGRQVLIDETMQEVIASLSRLEPQTVPIRTRILRPLIEDDGIVKAQEQLQILLSQPVTLRAQDREWQWSAQDLGALVQITHVPRSEGGFRLDVSLDRAMLEQRVSQFTADIDMQPVEPEVRFTGRALEITASGQNGAHLEVAQAVDLLATTLWQPERMVLLSVTIIPPRVRPETLASLGISEIVAQGKSSFEDSAPYRVQNIQAGARQMDGVLIAPGEEFSFNHTVGVIDESNGFTQGYAIIDGRTQLEWGGVCQVSTTVFRAAFWAGVPITERNQHS